MTDVSDDDNMNCPSPNSADGEHCVCWWDGEECHYCKAPALSDEDRKLAGMEPREVHCDGE